MTTVRTDSQIPWSASGVERSCKVSNLQRHRRARSDPNCLRPACPAGGSDADLTVGPGRSPSFPVDPERASVPPELTAYDKTRRWPGRSLAGLGAASSEAPPDSGAKLVGHGPDEMSGVPNHQRHAAKSSSEPKCYLPRSPCDGEQSRPVPAACARLFEASARSSIRAAPR
jgi:hypothetical protein